MRWNFWRRRPEPCGATCPVCREPFAAGRAPDEGRDPGTAVVCGPQCVDRARAQIEARRAGPRPVRATPTCCAGGAR